LKSILSASGCRWARTLLFFGHWADKTNAEKMNHWLSVLSRITCCCGRPSRQPRLRLAARLVRTTRPCHLDPATCVMRSTRSFKPEPTGNLEALLDSRNGRRRKSSGHGPHPRSLWSYEGVGAFTFHFPERCWKRCRGPISRNACTESLSVGIYSGTFNTTARSRSSARVTTIRSCL
jgi:hypothetical protein